MRSGEGEGQSETDGGGEGEREQWIFFIVSRELVYRWLVFKSRHTHANRMHDANSLCYRFLFRTVFILRPDMHRHKTVKHDIHRMPRSILFPFFSLFPFLLWAD